MIITHGACNAALNNVASLQSLTCAVRLAQVGSGRKSVLLLALRGALAAADSLRTMMGKPQVRVVHRNIKPANLVVSNSGWALCDMAKERYEELLLVSDGNGKSRVKASRFMVIDYGLSQGVVLLCEVENAEALVLPAGIEPKDDSLISAPCFGWGTLDT